MVTVVFKETFSSLETSGWWDIIYDRMMLSLNLFFSNLQISVKKGNKIYNWEVYFIDGFLTIEI